MTLFEFEPPLPIVPSGTCLDYPPGTRDFQGLVTAGDCIDLRIGELPPLSVTIAA